MKYTRHEICQLIGVVATRSEMKAYILFPHSLNRGVYRTQSSMYDGAPSFGQILNTSLLNNFQNLNKNFVFAPKYVFHSTNIYTLVGFKIETEVTDDETSWYSFKIAQQQTTFMKSNSLYLTIVLNPILCKYFENIVNFHVFVSNHLMLMGNVKLLRMCQYLQYASICQYLLTFFSVSAIVSI